MQIRPRAAYRPVVLSLVTTLIFAGAAAQAQVPQGSPTDLPVLSDQVPLGSGSVEATTGPQPVAKVADGDISDWVGTPSGYGGTAIYSAGELIYQDHLFDANGPDDGRDAERFARTAPLEVIPGWYRVDALSQADAPGELGVPAPDQVRYDDTYGDATSHQDVADLNQVRVALDGDQLALLARTTTMNASTDTALLLIADTAPGTTARPVGFGSGLTTSVGDVALFITHGKVLVSDLATENVSSLGGAVAAANEGDAADASEWTNALEVTLPLAAVAGPTGGVSFALAAGRPDATGTGFAPLAIETNNETAHANVANVAFRFDEPVRVWFERDQALALNSGTIDDFVYDFDVDAMRAGVTQKYTPGAGYHDRIFLSDPSTGVPRERGRDGIVQHYGVFLPTAYNGSPLPLQWWLHWRGGTAHSGGAIVPKVFKQFGEDVDTIVVAPSGRGTSTWYVGRGQVDILEVWENVFDTFAIDRSRVYVTGHSMGGWGSYLLSLLYPDRFAAAAPVAGPVTQGLWSGVDFPGCDEFQYDEYALCYTSANGSRPRDQHTLKLLENARHVPYAILQGTSDELVWYPGVARQADRLRELGYRYRFYTYPGYEHYSHPIADQWSEAAAYLHTFVTPKNPARVTYKRDILFERATEEVQSDGVALNFDFDSAYWMSGLTPVDMTAGTASFDGSSFAIAGTPQLAIPDTGPPAAPGQTGPYVITGMQWIDDPTATVPATRNEFQATLTGASAVTLDLVRMSLDVAQPVTGSITSDNSLVLRLQASWTVVPAVLLDGVPASVQLDDGELTITIPAGSHTLVITPA